MPNEIKLPHFLNVAKVSDKEAEIDIFGDIGPSWFSEGFTKEHLKQILKDLGDVAKIKVNISSFGGSLNDGLVIHDLLAQHPAHITTNVYGMTASAATVIAQAGNERTISENAMYLIHLPMTIAIGNVNDMQVAVDDLTTMGEQLIDLYKKATGMSRPEVKKLINENNGNGKWLTPEECKNYGLVDSVFAPSDKGIQNMSKAMMNTYQYPELPMKNETDKQGEGVFAELKNMFNQIMNVLNPSKKEGEEPPAGAEPIPAVTSEQVTAIEAKITDAEAVNAQIRQEYADLEAEAVTLRQTITDSQAKITTLEGQVAGLTTQLAAGSTKIKGVEGQENTEGRVSALAEKFSKDIDVIDARLNDRSAVTIRTEEDREEENKEK